MGRVDDTGVGIDEADLPRVFDVAYRGSNDRVPRSDSSLPSGSGLGLAIAAGLVQAHRGTLSAHNLDTGARFEVRLPLAGLGFARLIAQSALRQNPEVHLSLYIIGVEGEKAWSGRHRRVCVVVSRTAATVGHTLQLLTAASANAIRTQAPAAGSRPTPAPRRAPPAP